MDSSEPECGRKKVHRPPPTTQQKIHAVAPYFPQIFDVFLNFLIDIFLHLLKLQPDFLVNNFIFFGEPQKIFIDIPNRKKIEILQKSWNTPKKNSLFTKASC